ncbi:nucleoside hydrolase [Candidatus Woesearchaeota archaeon]|nr:nucleoside hydrolase [Candidatus Woesearchaeota archaeon]
MTGRKKKFEDVIIDTDPGHDDAMALMLALKSQIFKVHAITTVAGNSGIENTTRNVRFILKLLEREDIPVYSGAKKPLKRELVTAVVHGKSGLEGIDPKNPAKLTNNAVSKIISIVKENPGKITLITLGPLTNIAKAIKQNPRVMRKLKAIVMMGGAIRVAGNMSRVAEFNIFVDPEAADIVMGFPVKKAIIPLDACNHVVMQPSDFAKITNQSLAIPIKKMIKPYIANTLKVEGINGALMYDPLTVYYLINPKASKTKEMNVVVKTKGELAGMTAASKKEPANVTVVERTSAKQFKEDFINILSL